MKKTIALFLTVLMFCIFLAGCVEPDPNYVPPEEPHLYWKDVDVVIEDMDQYVWGVRPRRRKLTITVYSEEYDLRKTFTLAASGINAPIYWNAKEGDIVKAQLYSWVMDSTGEVIRREINCLK